MTYTYVLLQVSKSAYDEIKAKLEAVDYQHCFHDDHDSDGVVIDMRGIALQLSAAPSPTPNPALEQELAEIRERHGKATPGPYEYEREGHDRVIRASHHSECNGENCGKFGQCIGGHVLLREDSRPSWTNRLYDEGSWKFFAHSWVDINRLLSIIESLRGGK